VAWRELLDWEEGVFRTLLALWQRLVPKPPLEREDESFADFDREARRLGVLAQLLTGEPIRLRRARGVGGVRGSDLLLPATLGLSSDIDANREAYRVQTVIASGIRRLTRGRRPPDEDTFESALASLRIAYDAVELMCSELPNFRAAHERVAANVLAARSRLESATLPAQEALLEQARRAALAGERVWDDAALCTRLVGPRTGRLRSPELPVWGSWLQAADDAAVGTSPASSAPGDEPTTEIEAPDVDSLRRSELDSADTQDPAPIAPFERAESLDSYRGGARELDGSDELAAHLDALEQVDLGDLFRGSESTQSLLKADLELGVEIADEGDPLWAASRLVVHRKLTRTLKLRLEALRAGLRAVPRQLDGEEVDLEAVVDDQVAQRAGYAENPRVYRRQKKRRREFATTVLIDVSMSTDSWVDGRRTLDVSREAALVLGEVAHQLGDRVQFLAFASETRNRCHVWEVLRFGESWELGKLRIAGLQPQGYTRIGPALRHATALLSREPAERRLLLLISDGKPTDYDRYEGRYGVADVRRALLEAERGEIHTHALAVDSVARDYLPALFGESGWHVLARPEDLVEVLTAVYGRLTAR
jgi:nitric oxide reductase NorD protein